MSLTSVSSVHSAVLAANANVSSISWTRSESLRASWERASASSSHHSGMMLRALPPLIRPTFAVVSSSIRPSRRSAIARDAAAIAERPSSGTIPECAGRPWKRTSIERWYGAPMITSPIGAAWS